MGSMRGSTRAFQRGLFGFQSGDCSGLGHRGSVFRVQGLGLQK